MEGLPKLKYCCKKSGTWKGSHCANIAAYKVKLRSKKNDSVNASTRIELRCEKHKGKATQGMKVIEQESSSQLNDIIQINNWLRSLVGKTINSSWHSCFGLTVKYLKENCSVMCYHEYSKKWKLVYYNQIELIKNG